MQPFQRRLIDTQAFSYLGIGQAREGAGRVACSGPHDDLDRRVDPFEEAERRDSQQRSRAVWMMMGGEDRPEPTGPPEPKFRSLGWRIGNAFVSVLARVGIGPIHLLTTRGSRSGRPHTVPVVPVDHDGKSWLVAPYGAVAWVRNARSTGRVSLRYGRTTRDYATREASADEAGPVLKRYVAIATKTRPLFEATPDAPAADFAAEADRHPVFELVAMGSDVR